MLNVDSLSGAPCHGESEYDTPQTQKGLVQKLFTIMSLETKNPLLSRFWTPKPIRQLKVVSYFDAPWCGLSSTELKCENRSLLHGAIRVLVKTSPFCERFSKGLHITDQDWLLWPKRNFLWAIQTRNVFSGFPSFSLFAPIRNATLTPYGNIEPVQYHSGMHRNMRYRFEPSYAPNEAFVHELSLKECPLAPPFGSTYKLQVIF